MSNVINLEKIKQIVLGHIPTDQSIDLDSLVNVLSFDEKAQNITINDLFEILLGLATEGSTVTAMGWRRVAQEQKH